MGAALCAIFGGSVGCSVNPPTERSFAVPKDTAFRTAEVALTGWQLRVRNPEAGRLRTYWLEAPSERAQGLLIRGHFVQRTRVTVDCREAPAGGSVVAVRARREERPPAGSRAYRWTTAPRPYELEKEILDSIGVALTRTEASDEASAAEAPTSRSESAPATPDGNRTP